MKTKQMSPLSLTFVLVMGACGITLLWNFPHTAYMYGGITFLFAYLICMFVLSLPLIVSETASHIILPKANSADKIRHFSRSLLFRWSGLLMMITCMLLAAFCIGMMSWSLNYVLGYHSQAWLAEQLFHKQGLTDIRHPLLHVTFMISVGIIASSLMIFLLVTHRKVLNLMLVIVSALAAIMFGIFTISALMLSGSWYGLEQFFTPHWDMLLSLRTWYHASVFALFTTFVGLGVLMCIGSLSKKSLNPRRFAVVFMLGNTLAALIASIMIFSILGHMSFTLKLPIDSIASEKGLNLLFVTLPNAMSFFPHTGFILDIMFYLGLFFATLVAASVLFETVLYNFEKTHRNLSRKAISAIVIAVIALILIVFSYLYTGLEIFVLDYFISHTLIFLLALIQYIIFAWIYDASRMSYQINKLTGVKLTAWFNICARLIAPPLLLVGLFYGIFDRLSTTSGWLLYFGFVIITIVFGIILQRKYRY